MTLSWPEHVEQALLTVKLHALAADAAECRVVVLEPLA